MLSPPLLKGLLWVSSASGKPKEPKWKGRKHEEKSQLQEEHQQALTLLLDIKGSSLY